MKDDRQIDSDFNYYQNANADADSVKAGFLVRQYEYGVVIDDLLRDSAERSVQHYLLLGRRGSGKSTLLRRLQIEIETNEKLSEAYIAVNLAEEQANIYRFYDLLEEIMRELEFRGVRIEWPDDSNVDVYSRLLLDAIHDGLSKQGKRLVLLLDNIDRVFESLGEDVALLREYLQNYGDIKIIGGSTRMTEHFWSYNNPFFEFFRVLQLKPLDNEEMKKLLLHWADQLKAPVLSEFVEKRPGQLQSVRILTDGLPRTLQFFVNILLTRDEGTGYDYLRLLMDKVTPLYQERLNHLPPSQRKIVLQLAFYWEATGAKELSAATRMESKVVSAQLSQLIDKGVVEKIPTNFKNNLYRLSERFFNLWLIFTQGSPKEKRRARYLSIFLENFYDAKQVSELAIEHYFNVQDRILQSNKAILLTKAYSQSKYISSPMRDLLIEETLQMPELNPLEKKELPERTYEILWKVLEEPLKNWNRIVEAILSIEQRDGIKEHFFGHLHSRKGDYQTAKENFLTSIDMGYRNSFSALAYIYEYENDLGNAEKYFRLGFEKGGARSAYYLAKFYYRHNKSKEQALNILQNAKPPLLRDEARESLLIILKIWNGNFGNIREDIQVLLKDGLSEPDFLIRNLLIHHQVRLVNDLFMEDVSRSLVERAPLLYYVSQLLFLDPKIIALKIPPELSETIALLRIQILRRRDFYYGTKEATLYLGQNVV